MRVHKGQILMTCSGTIGKVTLVSETLDNKIFSHDIIRMDIKDVDYVGFIYTYLRSNIGNTILQTKNYGVVIQHIEPEYLIGIPVQSPPKNIKRKINDIILRSFGLRDESNELIDKATKTLAGALKLAPLKEMCAKKFDDSVGVNNYSVKMSDLAGKLDASYHVLIVGTITEHLRVHAAEVIFA
jgi:type I restriction enzyme S subunit